MEFIQLPPFIKECKRLQKKYKSLNKDLENFKDVLREYPLGRGELHWNGLHSQKGFKVFKTRLMCRSVKGKKLRVVYAYHNETNNIEFIALIEIYFKGDKTNEDRERIQEYIKEKD